jgi:hypothetical protein
MAFSYKNSKGKTYFLHERSGTGKGGKGRIYFFSGKEEGGIDNLPDNYQITENTKTGLPVLKKKV